MSGVVKTVKGAFFGGAEKKAGQLGAKAAEEGIAEQRRQFDITQEQLAPFREAGVSALEQQQALLGLSGAEAQQQAISGLQQSPAQRFIEERQRRALLRSASATGQLGGGNIQTALQEQAAGFAGQQLQNQFSQLGALSGAGQQATTATGQLGAQAAGNIQQAFQAGAQARGSGLIGQAGGQREGVSRLLGGFI